LGEEVVLKDTKRILCLAFSPRGDLLATGGGERGIFFSTDFAIRVWRLPERTLVAELTDHTDDVTSLAFSPDGNILASSSLDGVRLWQLPEGRLLRTLEHEDVRSGIHRRGYDPLRFSPDSTVLAAGIHAWRLPDADLLPQLYGFRWRPDNLEVGSESNWEAYQLHRHNFTGVILSPSWSSLAIAQKNRIEVYCSDDGKLITQLEAKGSHMLWDFALSGDDRRLCACCNEEGNNRIVIWSLPGGERLLELEDGLGGGSVAFSMDGQLLVSGHHKEGLRLWRVADGQHLARRDFSNRGLSLNGAMTVAFSPDDQWLAAGSTDKCVRLWPVVRH